MIMTPVLMAIFCLVTAGCANITDQQTSESQHNQQVAILKQIRKVNDDGSYTFGYEAGDGSFKVESRDVLGNVKGTFGFVDADGEIKRVTYTASNGTGFKATTVSPLQEHVTSIQSRVNRTTSTRKPIVAYATSSETSTSSVVQSIPRTRKQSTTPETPSSTTGGSTSTSTTESTTRQGLPQFRTTSRSRSRFSINGQQRPHVLEEETEAEGDSQIKKPEEKVPTFRKVIFAKRPVDVTLRPITEEFEEKEEEDKITTGNTLRRQLHEDTTKSVPVVNVEHHHEDDHGDHVYGGALSTSRPLFTINNPPRVVQRVASLRQERAKTLYVNNRETLAPARYEPPRTYESDAKIQDERENAAAAQQQVLIEPPRDQVRDYPQQNPEQPIYVRKQNGYSRVLPPGGILVRGPPPENLLEDDPASYRTPLPINRALYRPSANQQPIYSTTTEPNIHYLTEQPIEDPRLPINPDYVRRDRLYRPIPPYREQHARARPAMFQPVRPIPRPIGRPVDDRDYQSVSPDGYQYSGPIALPPEHPNPIAPPLSRRDFQILLRRLLVSQYGVQALTYPKTYLEDALYDQQPYPSYQPSYRTAAPREDLGYEARYGDRVPLVRAATADATSANGYSRSMSPAYQSMRYDDYQDNRAYPKRVYRQKFYSPEESEDGDEILPPPIREALLLRMLQLAINSDRPPMTMAMPMTTSSPASRYRKLGPVRSVQIITDDSEEEKEARKNM
ncbi:uncharacterized protein LOC117178922 isoform X2 [Belonocnema kinseyi]|uniref:uncharacterized protein LOC117178922 isoform X2 n=1 Tax=Belonocnema kinseyi TaxID=2817044 RepID=UPI00143CE144|nr:uncharacterized protein LOC117178922 isoform X2 [Belonocnema kinseyi]